MNFQNFTIKAQEALQQAVTLAQNNGQQAVTPTHLLHGVLHVGENVTQFLLGKTGVNTQQLLAVTKKSKCQKNSLSATTLSYHQQAKKKQTQ